MQEDLLLSTAYFPPIGYFSLIRNAGIVFIEREENYIKQSYRNRLSILSANGVLTLSVPVMKGSLLKTKIKDITIDYSKRWQHNHLRAMASAYSRSPYFQFYSDSFEKIILGNYKFLLDLNDELLNRCLEIMKINKCFRHTSSYEAHTGKISDYRYSLTPKKPLNIPYKPYIQVFNNDGFVPGLSITDLLFNAGPESAEYL
jgi:hypothetical protein